MDNDVFKRITTGGDAPMPGVPTFRDLEQFAITLVHTRQP